MKVRVGHALRAGLVGVAALAILVSGCSKKGGVEAGTLRYPIRAKVKGLDPIHADDEYSGTISHAPYENLYQYHYLKRPFTLVPQLASAMPTISKDGKTWTIPLRQGVMFHDDPSFKATGGKGREMTADDVIYSFKRLADPQNRSPGWWVLDGKILGLNAWREAASKAGTTDYSAPVEGLTALDKYTLQLKLPQASYQLIYSLQMTFTSIVPREAVEQYGKEFINHAVGTGPWKLSEFNGSAKAVFVKNPTYREELYPSEGEAGDAEKGLLADSGKRLPLADKLVYTIFVEDQPMWLNFMKGTLDTTTIPKDNYAQAVGPDGQMTPDMKAQNIVLHVTPLLDVTHESFNMDDPLVGKNKYLRQALSLAINDKPFIETFYNGRAIPAQGPIPPGLAGYDEKLKNPYRQFNLEKAKQLLAKAGFPEGKGLPTLEYITYSSSTNRQLNEYIEREWATLGVKVKFTTYSWPEFQASIKNRKGQIWSFAWGGDYPDAENFLQLFYSKNGSPGPNDANFKNAEFDRLYEKALALPDSPARTALYQQMQAIVIEESPWIPMVHRLGYNATRSWLKNFKRLDEQHNPAKYYRVEAPAKN